MSQFLRADSPLVQKLHLLGELIVLSLMFLLCCLPVFTVGAAVSALYDSVWHIKNSSGQPIRGYWGSFRSNFRKATLLWLPVLITGLLLGYGAILVSVNAQTGISQLKLPLILGFSFWVMTASWLFPLQSRFENSLKQTLINAILCALRFLPRTLLLGVINLLPWFLLWFSTRFFLWFGTLWVLVWPGLAAYWNICILEKPFRQLIELLDPPETQSDPNT